MDHKKEFKKLVEIVKIWAKNNGTKLTNTEIASRLDIKRTYLSDLLGEPGKDVTEKHVNMFKKTFRDELLGVSPGAQTNPERALLAALLEEFSEFKAEKESITPKEAKAQIVKRASTILGGLETWLPK